MKKKKTQDTWISYQKKKPPNGKCILFKKGNKTSDMRVGKRSMGIFIITYAGWGFGQDEMIQRSTKDIYWMDLPAT